MERTRIYLTAEERDELRRIARQTGKKQGELIRRAIDDFIGKHQPKDFRAALERVWGIWKDRDDLPDFPALRRELDR